MRSQQGFTLIELVVVVVILAIVSVLGGRFIVSTITTYTQIEARTSLVNTSRQGVEQISRILREALPHSLRTTNNNQCLEFLPIVSSGFYRDWLPDASNGALASASINTAPYLPATGSTLYLAVGARAVTEIYGAAPGSLAPIAAMTPTTISLQAAKQWLRNSPQQRFFIVQTPQAICVLNSELRFYTQQSLTDSSVDVSAAYRLLADQVVADAASAFQISQATPDRNVRVQLAFRFSKGREQLSFTQEVVLRNVP